MKLLGDRPDYAQLAHQLSGDAVATPGYLVLLVGAALMASFGLEQNSAATIIGAMVVAPMMLPIRSLGFGLLRFGAPAQRAFGTLASSIAAVIALGAVVGAVAGRPDFGSEILSRTSVTFLGLGVAIVGGVLSALSRLSHDSNLSDSLIGVGISVSLVPPLCTVGIMLAAGEWFFAWNALLLFLTNVTGIALACMVVFWFAGYGSDVRRRTYAGSAVFVALLASLSPSLYLAGSRARQESAVTAFLNARAGTFIPGILQVESTSVGWKAVPPRVTAVIRVERKPSIAQVRRLNEALDDRLGGRYALFVFADPAVSVPLDR